MFKKIALSALAVCVLAGGAFAQAKIVFKLAEVHVKGYPTTEADYKFAELVNKYTNGDIRVDVYPGGELSSDEKAVIEQVKVGAIQIARVSTGTLGAFNKQMEAFGLPFLFDNNDHLWAFLNSAYGQKMLTDLTPSGFFGLTWYDAGARSFYSKNPINTPADIKGQKFRMIGNAILLKMAAALGASAVSMSTGQVLGALQTGVLDGAENNPPSLLSFNHYQFVKYYTLDEHAVLPEALIISKLIWDKLNDAQKKAINQAADETVKFQREAWNTFTADAMKKLKDAGIVITPVPDKTAWKAAVKDVFEAEKGPFLETVKAIEAARPAKK